MSALSDIVTKLFLAAQLQKKVVTTEAVKDGIPLVKADDEALDQIIGEGLRARLKAKLTQSKRNDERSDVRQMSFFGDLRQRYALPQNVIKDTPDLTRAEFHELIAVRRAQIVADQAELGFLERAAAAVETMWDANPELTFGQIEKLYVKSLKKPKAGRSSAARRLPTPPVGEQLGVAP